MRYTLKQPIMDAFPYDGSCDNALYQASQLGDISAFIYYAKNGSLQVGTGPDGSPIVAVEGTYISFMNGAFNVIAANVIDNHFSPCLNSAPQDIDEPEDIGEPEVAKEAGENVESGSIASGFSLSASLPAEAGEKDESGENVNASDENSSL